MTVAIIDKQIAQTLDRLDRCAAQIEVVSADFKRHCYEWHVNQNKQSQSPIEQLRQERRRLVEEQEALASALAGLEQRKADAREAAARDADKEHARNALATLRELESLGPELDRLAPHPHPEDGVAEYCPADPPRCCRAAELMAALVNQHLRALKLTEASFPKCWHGAASKFDLERELMKTIAAGWPSVAVNVAPRWKAKSVMPGQAQRNPQISSILSGWGAVIRKNLLQYETKVAA